MTTNDLAEQLMKTGGRVEKRALLLILDDRGAPEPRLLVGMAKLIAALLLPDG